jgi:hypothetical protein
MLPTRDLKPCIATAVAAAGMLYRISNCTAADVQLLCPCTMRQVSDAHSSRAAQVYAAAIVSNTWLPRLSFAVIAVKQASGPYSCLLQELLYASQKQMTCCCSHFGIRPGLTAVHCSSK